MAGRMLFAHSAIPFLAEKSDTEGKNTINTQAKLAAATANMYLYLFCRAFRPKNFISMVNSMNSPWIIYAVMGIDY